MSLAFGQVRFHLPRCSRKAGRPLPLLSASAYDSLRSRSHHTDFPLSLPASAVTRIASGGSIRSATCGVGTPPFLNRSDFRTGCNSLGSVPAPLCSLHPYGP